ncbi:TRAP transporter small permease [Reinekea marina]|uniref:TRAP transporter small permease protein n=1 Tax=Reinekea marina TaxID=1310421 RepID=A0ABV7WRG5_9GAMM|nr:TRAP transporter small permease [Reinekea marina]MDN3650304.1 TRAP transporter small permease [Reinekea marina]
MRVWIERWASFEKGLLVAILLCMILLAVLQIVLRNVFGTSLFWIDPFNRLLVLWLAVLGAMVATKEGEHIAIDALKHYWTGAKLWAITKLALLFASLVSALMAYHSARFVYDEYVYETQTFSELPAWPFELIMPVGFSIMALRFTIGLFSTVKEPQS